MPEKLALLKQLYNKTHCVFVMSSSWRHFWFNKKFADNKSLKHIKRLVKYKYHINIIDKTGSEYDRELWNKYCGKDSRNVEITELYDRGFQIKNWLNKHKEVKHFAIYDDDDGDLHLFKENFIQTSWYGNGLEQEHIDRAIKLLNA